MRVRVLVPGHATGELLRLEGGLSFWGGVDPRTGRIIAPDHPQHGRSIAGRIIALDRSIGSSSGSSVLLELLARGRGPRAILLGEPDLILTLGAVVAREMGYGCIPVLQAEMETLSALPPRLAIDAGGALTPAP